MANCSFYTAHWLFAFRYFEVAEMFGRDDETQEKHDAIRKITSKISYVGCAIICINWITFVVGLAIEVLGLDYYNISAAFNSPILHWTFYYIPCGFLFIDFVLLLIGLSWICYSLRHDPQVMGNEKWMAVHTGLLLILLSSNIYWVV